MPSPWTSEQVWTDGDAWFADLLAAIAAARARVWLETYILAPDALGARVVAALRAAAARGCDVRLLVDGIGAAAWLRACPACDPGIPLRVWNPLPWAAARRAGMQRRWRWLAAINRRDHRKVCLIDADEAWVGSFNVDGCHLRELSGDAAWRDSGARVRGAGAGELQAAIEHAWRRAWPVVDGRVRLSLPRDADPARAEAADSLLVLTAASMSRKSGLFSSQKSTSDSSLSKIGTSSHVANARIVRTLENNPTAHNFYWFRL